MAEQKYLKLKTLGKYSISYNDDIDIDGFNAAEHFTREIQTLGSKKVYNNAHEAFCGHGAIGFYQLSSGLCDRMSFSDFFPDAVNAVNLTIEQNNLSSKCYASIENCVPEPQEKFDLLLANPPWRINVTSDVNSVGYEHEVRKKVDQDWQTHIDFFNKVNQAITDDADIFMYEDAQFSTPDTFKEMINQANLEVVAVVDNFCHNTGYLMQLKKLNQ